MSVRKYVCRVVLSESYSRGWGGVVEAEDPEQAAAVARDREIRDPKHKAWSSAIAYVEVRALPTGEFLGEF